MYASFFAFAHDSFHISSFSIPFVLMHDLACLSHPSIEGGTFTKFLDHEERSFIMVQSSDPARPVSFSSSDLIVKWGFPTRRLASGDHRRSFPVGSS